MAIDKRRHYILMLDTETANTIPTETGLDMSNVLVYDIGWAVIDKSGNVYECASFVNRDVFVYERDLMQSAYYASKIPMYIEDLRQGYRTMADLREIRAAMLDTMERYNIKTVCAHNARFDLNACNGTQRYCTKSKWRYWFPYGTEIWDTLKMSQDVIVPMPTYRAFCEENGYKTKNGQYRKTAEILYQFISGNHDFTEEHTGLADVMIEKEILAYCFRQKKPMRKLLFENSKEFPVPTELQKQIMNVVRNDPMR